jgi:hypothetical protein
MSNAIVVPDSFKNAPSTVFAGAAAGDDLSGGITGGYGLIKYKGKVWSITYHGNNLTLMRDDGDGPRGSIDVVIVKANAQLSKTWYENGYDEGNSAPPDCASANGVIPDAGVAKKQSDICATCPRNAWGSAPGGGKGKACGDHRRLAVVPLTDIRNESFGGPLLLRCPAASLQDMAAFDSRYKGMGYPYFSMAIKIGFDATESFPKFTFNAIRPLTDNEAKVVVELRGSPETARVVNEGSAPAQAAAIAAPAKEQAFLEAIPDNAVKPAVTQVVVQPAAAAVASPAVAQPAQPAAAATGVTQGNAGAGEAVHSATPAAGGGTAGGFGPVATQTAAAPAAAQATQPSAGGFGAAASQPATQAVQPSGGQPAVSAAKPVQQTMTGFGGAAPDPVVPAQVTQQVTAAPDPEVVTAFEGSIDDRLNALLAG